VLRPLERPCNASGVLALLEQVGMRADAHEDDLLVRTAALQLVDERKVAADVAFVVVGPSGASFAIGNDMASFRRFMSKRPECTRTRPKT
jgi:hypothetical protein